MAKSKETTPETLLEAILVMQAKILQTAPAIESASLTYEAEMGDGRTIIRANPFVQEFRALVKDYSVALKTYKELTGDGEFQEGGNLDSIRQMLKVIP